MEKELDTPEKKPVIEDPLDIEDDFGEEQKTEEVSLNEEALQEEEDREDDLTAKVDDEPAPRKTFETNIKIDGGEKKEEEVKASRLDAAADDTNPAEHTLDDLTKKDVHIPHLNASRLSSLHERHQPTNPEASRAKKSNLPILILAGVTLGVIAVTIFILKGGTVTVSFKKDAAASPTPNPEAAPIVSEQPSSPTPPAVSFDRTKYKLRVLNGTTKAGLASSEADKLKNLGYQIDKTGNAPTQSIKQTVVKIKSQQKELLDQLVLDLAPGFEATSGSSLSDDDTVDGEIVLGSK